MTGPAPRCGHVVPIGVARCPYCTGVPTPGFRHVRLWPRRLATAVVVIALAGAGWAVAPRLRAAWDERRAVGPTDAALTASTLPSQPVTVTDEPSGLTWSMQAEPVRRSIGTPAGNSVTGAEIRIYVAAGPDLTQRVVVYDLAGGEPAAVLGSSNGLAYDDVGALRPITIDGLPGHGALLHRDETSMTPSIVADAWTAALPGGRAVLVSTIAAGDDAEAAPRVDDLAVTVDAP